MKESTEQSFGQYWAAKNGVTAYGLSEFEDDSNFATVSANPASWAAKLTSPSDPAQTASLDRPDIIHLATGSGKTHVLLGYTVRQSRTIPTTLVASGGTVTPTTVGHSGKMATQNPSTADESVGEIIWRVATALPLKYRAKLAVRLNELQQALYEEDFGCSGITVASLHHFVEFLRSRPDLRGPAVSASPDGNIYASWKSAPDRVFSIHFLPDGKVRFVIFRPNDKHPGDVIRLSGTATVDMIITTAAPHGVLEWASDERSADTRL